MSEKCDQSCNSCGENCDDSSTHYLFKGWVFSLCVFTFAYAITLFFQVPGLVIIQPYTVASNLLSSSIFGLTLAEATKRIVSDEPLN